MTDDVTARLVQILLVEDISGGVSPTREALRGAKVVNHLDVVRNGPEALAFLRGEGEYTGRQRPDLVLLDLDLLGTAARELLVELKEDEDLKDIPVVVLTTSPGTPEVVSSYDLLARAIVAKPVVFEDFLLALNGLEEFWLRLVRLPSDGPVSGPAPVGT